MGPSMQTRGFLFQVPAGLLFLLAVSFVFGEQAPTNKPQDSPSMVLKVTTHLVIVDAVVTDRSGNAVRDLKKEDFRIYENGKPQEIRVFSFQEALPERESRVTKRTLPENVFTNIPDTNAQRRTLAVLLIDAVNTSTADRVYLHEQL